MKISKRGDPWYILEGMGSIASQCFLVFVFGRFVVMRFTSVAKIMSRWETDDRREKRERMKKTMRRLQQQQQQDHPTRKEAGWRGSAQRVSEVAGKNILKAKSQEKKANEFIRLENDILARMYVVVQVGFSPLSWSSLILSVYKTSSLERVEE